MPAEGASGTRSTDMVEENLAPTSLLPAETEITIPACKLHMLKEQHIPAFCDRYELKSYPAIGESIYDEIKGQRT